jgi:hypothetical protein
MQAGEVGKRSSRIAATEVFNKCCNDQYLPRFSAADGVSEHIDTSGFGLASRHGVEFGKPMAYLPSEQPGL